MVINKNTEDKVDKIFIMKSICYFIRWITFGKVCLGQCREECKAESCKK